MPLPPVAGWLIDFRTAHGIFSSQSNVRITHCVERCADGSLHICHTEAERFKQTPGLAGPFMIDHYRVFEPDEDIFQRCEAIGANGCGKRVLPGKDTGIYLTAIAAANSFGVISDHRSNHFATVYDMCALWGVPVLSADDYFALL